MKVRLNALKIEDTEGQYGPQKKVNFKQILPEGERWVSGWIPSNKFNESDWQNGKEIDLTITQKGKFWNCSIPNKTSLAIEAVEAKSSAQHDEIMNALREIFKKLNAMSGVVESVQTTIAKPISEYDDEIKW